MPILDVFVQQAAAVARAVRKQMGEDPDPAVRALVQHGPDGIARELDLATRSGYTVGLEIGLAIAITDIAAGRRLLDFIFEVVQDSDARALEGRTAQARSFLEVLD